MKKRILGIIEAILLGILFTFWETNNFVVKELNGSFLDRYSMGRLLPRTSTILPLVFWVLFLIYLVMCCISIFSNKNQGRNNKVFYRVLVVCVAVWFNICMITTFNVDSYAPYRIVTNKFPTVIFELFLLAMMVVAFIKTAVVDTNDIEEKPGEIISNADELKKFKELLDMGVITQEEFDAKKKELLGL